jgi:hypothetical protein
MRTACRAAADTLLSAVARAGVPMDPARERRPPMSFDFASLRYAQDERFSD